jgi:nitrite reductase/ring-hydroxylating ferredoxin subunit
MSMHSVCRSDELGIGQMKAFAVGTQRIVLFHLTNGFFATQANCTHMFAPLARGDRRGRRRAVPISPGAFRHPYRAGC